MIAGFASNTIGKPMASRIPLSISARDTGLVLVGVGVGVGVVVICRKGKRRRALTRKKITVVWLWFWFCFDVLFCGGGEIETGVVICDVWCVMCVVVCFDVICWWRGDGYDVWIGDRDATEITHEGNLQEQRRVS